MHLERVIAKVISGGQTGVDVAALRAAKSLGIPTGGTMPKDWITLAGPRPEYAAEFGMVECDRAGYPPRTYANVKDADFTVRIALDFSSPGERLTIKAIEEYGRPSYGFRVRRFGQDMICDRVDIGRTADLIRLESARLGRPIVVNFAGNSEKTAPGIERYAEALVREILRRCI